MRYLWEPIADFESDGWRFESSRARFVWHGPPVAVDSLEGLGDPLPLTNDADQADSRY